MAVTQNLYTGNGSTTQYSFSFPYLAESDIKVSLNGTLTTAYSLANATTINLNSAPGNGVAIRIFRETNDSALNATFYAGSAIRSVDLNDNFTQNLYVTQEARNEAASSTTTANTAKSTADASSTASAAATATANQAAADSAAAVSTSNSAATSATNALTTVQTYVHDGNNPVGTGANGQPQGLAYAINTANSASSASTAATNTANAASSTATTALNNSRQSDGQGGFDTAISIANSAKTTATQSAADSAQALSTANASQTASAAATSTANSANTQSASAVSTANTASANATAALNNSRQSDGQGGFDSAISIANTANTTANTALANSRQSNGQGGFDSAISIANAASATANAASTAVSTAAFYSPIAALANLPSSPSNEDRVEVINSTGVQSSSAVSGVPSGFVGSTDLTVRLQYNSSTSKWVWQQYFAADPENRYATSYLPVIKGDGTSSGQVGKITLNCSNNNHGVSIQSPAHSAGATYTLTLPTGLPSLAGQALTSDTQGNLSFTTVDAAFIESPQTLNTSKVISANTNAGLMGPTVALASGVTITVGSNSRLTVLS